MAPFSPGWRRLPLAGLLLASALHAAPTAEPLQPVPPLAGAGRWLVDATGRVVMLHGVNDVEKSAPYHSAGAGFGADDVAFLRSEGFNALRLGIDMRGLMPSPGQVDDGYIDQLATTISQCAAAGIFVLLDFHQDGYAPRYNGNGFPDWMAIDDGLPNPPDAVFPLYYVQNPAMQRAFEHLWDNTRVGDDGLGLQDYLLQAVSAVAARFGHDPMVLGTELINEPWPGAVWQPCISAPDGCPTIEAEQLRPFYDRSLATLRPLAPQQLLFIEPFVLFNFGLAPTSLPGPTPGFGLAFHSYAINFSGETNVVGYGVEAAERDAAPVLITEFGASSDPTLLNRLLGQFDAKLLPWMFWAYNEQIVPNRQVPLTPAAIHSQAALNALVRPYPIATTGIPTRIHFDPPSQVFEFTYSTTPVAGGVFPRRLETTVYLPRRHYPNGYSVKAPGARVTSAPCATILRLRTRHPGRPVSVRVTPGVLPKLRTRCVP